MSLERFAYSQYLTGARESVDRLVILEVNGARGISSAVAERLGERNARTIKYIGIAKPSAPIDEQAKDASRERVAQFLEQQGERVQYLSVPWDATDIPYALPPGACDEFHCHMLAEDLMTTIESAHASVPNVRDFARELSWITKPGSRAFFTMQTGNLLRPVHLYHASMASNATRFAYAMEQVGFQIEVMAYSERARQMIMRGEKLAHLRSAELFTDAAGEIDLLLIARQK